jgi:hypothetical protein
MAARRKPTANLDSPVAIDGPATTRRIATIAFAALNPAPYNPRQSTDAQIDSICRSILQFGIVDPFIVREEDNTLIGGHQRAKALSKLLAGGYVDPATKRPVGYTLPDGLVPVVLVGGLSDKDTKLLNLALNKVTGDWDDDKLASLLAELADGRSSFDDLLVSGFSAAEIVDYADLAVVPATNADEDGTGPLPAVRGPSLSLDFSSKEIRDAVKAKIVSREHANEPSGDVLARLLKVGPKRERPDHVDAPV